VQAVQEVKFAEQLDAMRSLDHVEAVEVDSANRALMRLTPESQGARRLERFVRRVRRRSTPLWTREALRETLNPQMHAGSAPGNP
jgi:hypothetical protein